MSWCGPQTCTEHKVVHCITVTFTVHAHVLISTVVHTTGGASCFHDNWQGEKKKVWFCLIEDELLKAPVILCFSRDSRVHNGHTLR